jgi:aryl-alcohol dehydrogenase-like predicted oxidoreductase
MDKNGSPALLVLAWHLGLGPEVVAFPGPTPKSRVDQNHTALELNFPTDHFTRIGYPAPVGAAAGTRYPADGMKRVYI